jgi:hypothetical protein
MVAQNGRSRAVLYAFIEIPLSLYFATMPLVVWLL